MLGKEFRGLAETVTRTYGDDPWFFLRELAQNSRDAGARTIRVTAAVTPGKMETLRFEDDGGGMTLAHARRFLFRLYASDKTGDPTAAGKYGIGFWTLFRFQPSHILLQSRRGNNCWAIEMDGDLAMRPVPCNLNHSGTTISLTRPAVFMSADEFSASVENGLLTYCQYLRRNDRRASMLPVCFNGKNLTRAMTLPGPLSFPFRMGTLEGAVGLAAKPQVLLYARGLPVWQGTVLEQMSHLQADGGGQAEIGRGLAPVFLLNGNDLDVSFSRNLALENRALARVRKKAQTALRRFLRSILEMTFPSPWQRRLFDGLRETGKRLRCPGWHWLPLFLLVVIPLEIIVLRKWFPPGNSQRSAPISLLSTRLAYGGATVSLSPAASELDFSYQPQSPSWFTLFVADAYDIQAGFVRSGERGRQLPPAPCPPEKAWHMRLQAKEGGEIFLPLATGHALAPGSLRLDGRRIEAVRLTPQGEALAVISPTGGTLEYRSCPREFPEELTAAAAARLTALPSELSLPPALEEELQATLLFPLSERVFQAAKLARERITYDAAPPIARMYRQLSGSSPWLANVLSIGSGDCDVINGLNVLILRKMGIPARLVIGLIGEHGRVRPLLHAWSEYFDHDWVVIDASAMADPAATISAAAVENATAPATVPRHRKATLPGGVLGPLLALLVLGGGLFVAIKKNRSRPPLIQPSEQIKRSLLQLIESALLQPNLWGRDNPLWRHRLLPMIGNDAISIEKALGLLRQKKLFITANRNPLAAAMAASGITVLDLSQTLYAPLRILLAGATDADLLCQLRPEPPTHPGSGKDLLDSVNTALQSITKNADSCWLSPGLRDADLLKISLPAPLKRPPFFFPQAFIAINPEGELFLNCSELFRRNPTLAVFRFLRRIHEDRLLDAALGTAWLKKAARRLLRSCS